MTFICQSNSPDKQHLTVEAVDELAARKIAMKHWWGEPRPPIFAADGGKEYVGQGIFVRAL